MCLASMLHPASGNRAATGCQPEALLCPEGFLLAGTGEAWNVWDESSPSYPSPLLSSNVQALLLSQSDPNWDNLSTGDTQDPLHCNRQG